jgi:hypothetical protein
MVAESDGKIDMKIVLRDENEEWICFNNKS